MKITDEKLLFLCRLYGERARYFRQKFLGLLPEVYKRGLYKNKGCSSIFEFAAKFAGVSEEQVSRVLNLEKKFENKPDLHAALVNGEVSVNKLVRVASIATPENQADILEQVKILPNRALEIFVRDEKVCQSPNYGVHVHELDWQSSITQVEQDQVVLSSEVKQKLLELQQKGIDINELILNTLEKRDQEIADLKDKIEAEQVGRASSRYVPVEITRLIKKEHGTKCSVPGCMREAEQIHHEIPFVMLKNHNPSLLKPLCREHHLIAHSTHFAFTRKIRQVH